MVLFAAYGWVLDASESSQDEPSDWTLIASKSGVLPDGSSITAAELEALSSLIFFLNCYYEHHSKALTEINTFITMDFTSIKTLTLADMA